MFLGQIISSLNFSLAQKLGLQEKPELADPILQRSERYVAYWDLFTLGWLPVAGILMIVNHPWWPIVALIGGAIYFDTSGREAAKFLSFKHQGVRMGSSRQRRLFFATYFIMAALGIIVVVYSSMELFNTVSMKS